MSGFDWEEILGVEGEDLQDAWDAAVYDAEKWETYDYEEPEPEKVYINCPYAEKDDAKELGAKWDAEEKSWYIMSNQRTEPFSKWL